MTIFKTRIAFASSNNRYLTFSFCLLFLFAAWEGPHHPRNLLLGVVYTAKVSPYQTHLMCGLRVWIIPTQIQIHAPALNSIRADFKETELWLREFFSHFVECRFIGESLKICFNSVLEKNLERKSRIDQKCLFRSLLWKGQWNCLIVLCCFVFRLVLAFSIVLIIPQELPYSFYTLCVMLLYFVWFPQIAIIFLQNLHPKDLPLFLLTGYTINKWPKWNTLT